MSSPRRSIQSAGDIPQPAANAQPPAPTVLGLILAWSEDKPMWQRDALLRILTTGSPQETDIALSAPELAKSLRRFYAAAKLRRAQCVSALVEEQSLALYPMPPSPQAELATFEKNVRKYAQELKEAANEAGRKRLLAERDELADRVALAGIYPLAQAEVARLQALSVIAAASADTDTRAITRLGNEIADEVITPKVRDRFHEEISRLAGSRVRVELIRSGGKYGSPVYQVKLIANNRVNVQDILSECHQQAPRLYQHQKPAPGDGI